MESVHANNERTSPIQPKKKQSSFALYEMKQKPPSLQASSEETVAQEAVLPLRVINSEVSLRKKDLQ